MLNESQATPDSPMTMRLVFVIVFPEIEVSMEFDTYIP